jgi:hypothetical protein
MDKQAAQTWFGCNVAQPGLYVKQAIFYSIAERPGGFSLFQLWAACFTPSPKT